MYIPAWNLWQSPSFMPKYGNLKIGRYLGTTGPRLKISSILTTFDRNEVYMKLVELLPLAKLMPNIEILKIDLYLKSCF